MGRGLSDLQKRILRMAAERARGPDPERLLRQSEILAVCYGFPTAPPRYKGDSRLLRGQNFDRAAVGRREYAAATAAVSRAVRRLEERGLVVRYTSGWNRLRASLRLTEAGETAARAATIREWGC